MNEKQHWLVRPSTIRLLWIVFIVILTATVLGEFFVKDHPHFALDAVFGFAAWYGFGACVIMVFASKVLGLFLKRRDTYYDD